mmetsp:Transcript_23439/g.28186  ORF Transcript_23439/g.28186 Transcript_23439/m.28186 type:complete len:115 (+) Transcript_23439:124-468(+)|eukprot:CAMPEP_0195292932 /NCGR_PEP_ID=MMETSP0707-20130614/11246_1 /TAXON_ID=33640 /ORGANISM="Asterionellopsis glacialis, Strain CCMP134" /LENGTH=114 /DNA_ID=CAMNT_0040353529 /DNA_START=191 /DNA_END=535 /DNA_ORIENTATION=-
MPLKFTKDLSTHLFKYVKSVDVKFNPFDNRTTSAREVLRQVMAERYSKANPKLQINTHVVGTPYPPSVVFKFVNDNEKIFDSSEYDASEIMYETLLEAMQINNEYEMEGKSIDD